MNLESRIKEVIPNHRFTASDIAHEIGYETKMRNGYYETCPNISRVLLRLCKKGFLYQWVIGVGGVGLLGGMSYNTHKWELYYLKRDTDLARTLEVSRGKYLSGYRFG